jgi:hypothetical protein
LVSVSVRVRVRLVKWRLLRCPFRVFVFVVSIAFILAYSLARRKRKRKGPRPSLLYREGHDSFDAALLAPTHTHTHYLPHKFYHIGEREAFDGIAVDLWSVVLKK